MSIEVQHVQQPSPVSCVHACLSMVTGIPVNNLLDRFGNHGLDREVKITVLSEMGIQATPMAEYVSPIIPKGVYFATVPSLNKQGHSHLCVVECDGALATIYDPNEGREGVTAYHKDGMHGEAPFPRDYKLTLLEELRRHRGTEYRQALYKLRKK